MVKSVSTEKIEKQYKIPGRFWGVGTYRGGWVNNQPEGHGIWEQNTVMEGWKVKVRYEGDWKAGEFDGRGEARYGNGDTYTGSFKAGNMDGRGIHTCAEGKGYGKYEGEFQGDWFHGEGTYTALNGRQFTGQWSYGKLNGTQYVDDLEREAKRLGPPPSPTSGSSSTSSTSTEEQKLSSQLANLQARLEEEIRAKEEMMKRMESNEKENPGDDNAVHPRMSSLSIESLQERKKVFDKKEAEEEERKRLQQEKRDAFFVELSRIEVSINVKQNIFSQHIQPQIQSGAGDPVFLLDQVKGVIIELDSIRLQLENKKNDLSILKTTKDSSYYEEVNQKRENLLINCEDLKKEMNETIESLQERKKVFDEKIEEEKPSERRTSGYTAFFKEEMEFDHEKLEEYRNNLKEKAKLPTKARFVKQIQKGKITATKLQEEYGFTEFDADDVIEKFSPSSPSSSLPLPSERIDHEYRLSPHDILFHNAKFYFDTELKSETSFLFQGFQNIFPVYGNNAEQRPLILKTHEDSTLRDAECQILKNLRHEHYIVSYIEKIDFVNQSLYHSLEKNKRYYGLILERGKWDLSKKMQTSHWKMASIDEKIIYVKQILEIVSYINDKGFIWRDVKPTNFVYFGDDLNLNGKLKAIDFDISLQQGTLIEDCQSTSFYTPPEIAELFQSLSSTNKQMFINETYDSWSSGMLILEMLDNCHFINTEIIGNHPHKAKSRQDSDILERLTEETFLMDIQNYIDIHHKNKALSYPILTSLLCEQEKRKSVKEVLSMSCLRINATSKTAKFIKEIKKTIDEMKNGIVNEISTENLAQYTHLKFMMDQIQSSLPKDRASLEHFLSNEVSRVISCLQKHSSQAEIINLRDTLLEELSSSHSSLEEITAQLEEGFHIINSSLEEVHAAFDTMTQAMVEVELKFVEKLNTLNVKEINLYDIKDIIGTLNTTQRDIEKLQGKENLKEEDVMKLITESILAISQLVLDSLKLFDKDALDRLETELKSNCKQSVENDHYLRETLTNLSQTIVNIKQKFDNLTNSNSLYLPSSLQNSSRDSLTKV